MVARTLTLTGKPGKLNPLDINKHAEIEASVTAHLSAAIRIKTISWNNDVPPESDAFSAFAAFLKTTYPSAHQTLTVEKINDSLLYRWPGKNRAKSPIGFIAHMDVVPVENGTENDWLQSPFSGAIHNDAVWGRGALDDKGSLITLMEAVERLAKSGFAPNRDIYLIFGHDEELGGGNGAGAMAKILHDRKIRFAWTLDEGSVLITGAIPGITIPLALISTAEKGSTSLNLIGKASGGHSSAPGKDTAVSIAAKAVIAVNDDPYAMELDDNVIAFLHAIAPEVNFLQRVALTNLWLTGPAIMKTLSDDPTIAATMRTTTAPTLIQGGTKVNALPQQTIATINYRIHPRDSTASVKARAIKQINDSRVEVVTVGASEPSPNSSRTSAGYEAISDSINDVFGSIPIAPSLTIAGTDTRHFTSLADDNYRFMPFVFETSDISRVHGTNERAPIKDLVRATLWYENLIIRTAGQ